LNEGRCLEQLLQAMTQVDCKLKLAGEGDLSSKLRALARELNLGDKVEFLGWVEPERLREITATATIGFNLLENKGLSYYYSLSNKFFDYMHAGLPQLCADFPEYRRVNAQFEVAVLTNDTSPGAIAAAINSLLANMSRLELMRQQCILAAKEYNWENEKPRLIQLFDGHHG
jgi:glycosyltransferase involved in cell wall biosynthesis